MAQTRQRKQNLLTARSVETAKDARRYSDGNGLYLAVRLGGSRQWAFIYRRDGKLSCLLCGKAEQGRDPLLPFETERTGHAWLHSHCWWAWSAARHAEGRCRLSGTGIVAPAWFPNDFDKNGGA
jgi:hypothetical protein